MHQGLYGWFSKNLRGRKGQQGFTLIELLVVVTILGVLAAIVTLSLVGLTTNASARACDQEYRTVQAALDAFMANNNLDTITAVQPPTAATNDMGTTLAVVGGNNLSMWNLTLTPSNPTNYVRNQHTQYYYQWDTHGHISAILDISGATIPNCTIH